MTWSRQTATFSSRAQPWSVGFGMSFIGLRIVCIAASLPTKTETPCFHPLACTFSSASPDSSTRLVATQKVCRREGIELLSFIENLQDGTVNLRIQAEEAQTALNDLRGKSLSLELQVTESRQYRRQLQPQVCHDDSPMRCVCLVGALI